MEKFEKYILKACNVRVVTLGVFFHVGKSICRSEAVQRGPGSPKLMYFRKSGKLEMYLGVFGVCWIVNCYSKCFYEIRCSFLYMCAYVKTYFLEHFEKHIFVA